MLLGGENTTKTNTKTLPCLIKAGIVIFVITLIVIIVAFVISVALVQKFTKKVSNAYKLNTLQYCKNLPTITYSNIIRKPKVQGVYEYQLAKTFLETSLLVTQSNCFNIVPIANPPGFTNQYRMIGSDPSDGKPRMFVTVFTNFDTTNQTKKEENTETEIKEPNRFLIVFTGTFTMNEWRDDFTYPLVEASLLNNYEPGIQVHKGFYGVYLAIREQLWNLYKANENKIDELYITGHSLGGALSTLCAFDFAHYTTNKEQILTHYSFAAPRSGNVAYSNKFNQMLPTSIRVYNTEDIIHSVPPAEFLGGYVYQHTNYGVPFDVNLGSIGANHITAYTEYLPKCVDNKAPCFTNQNQK